jgi:CIC family chloride channel protein
LFGSSILAILIFIFPTLLEKVMKVSKHYLITIRLLETHYLVVFETIVGLLLVFVGLTMMLKVFATGITFRQRWGGNFAPSLFLGSYVGFFFPNL